jgi:hypothetical protein
MSDDLKALQADYRTALNNGATPDNIKIFADRMMNQMDAMSKKQSELTKFISEVLKSNDEMKDKLNNLSETVVEGFERVERKQDGMALLLMNTHREQMQLQMETIRAIEDNKRPQSLMDGFTTVAGRLVAMITGPKNKTDVMKEFIDRAKNCSDAVLLDKQRLNSFVGEVVDEDGELYNSIIDSDDPDFESAGDFFDEFIDVLTTRLERFNEITFIRMIDDIKMRLYEQRGSGPQKRRRLAITDV